MKIVIPGGTGYHGSGTFHSLAKKGRATHENRTASGVSATWAVEKTFIIGDGSLPFPNQ